ncbi:hypothetical protein FJR05_17785 [Dolichospermum sp. UHCC 0259]|nr:hypothetical protein [Dolichospermum sp. UHCC 0259]
MIGWKQRREKTGEQGSRGAGEQGRRIYPLPITHYPLPITHYLLNNYCPKTFAAAAIPAPGVKFS